MKKQASKEKVERHPRFDYGYTLHEKGDYRSTWRIFRIMAELVEGSQFLSGFEREVTIMGSARFGESHEYYATARELGRLLGKNGFTTITGGGPGIMEAANRGAFESGGESIGLNIQLPFEQRSNPYVKKSIAFYYFFTRKVMLTNPANAFVFFPGGFGTLDEFFEVVDIMELGLMPKVPIVLVGSVFWTRIIDFLKQQCALAGVSVPDIESWHIADTAEQAFDAIKDVKDAKIPCDMWPNNFLCGGNVDWKIFQVMSELVQGFEFLTGLTSAVTILGTKAIDSDNAYYAEAHALGRLLAEKNYAVVTGAKSGIAEAVNKGVFELGGQSLGIGMKIGAHAIVNKYLTKSILFQFPFVRKFVLTAPTSAFVFFPGGFGTLHHFFEVLTLMQTRKIKRRPVLLYNHKFWEPIHMLIKDTLAHDMRTIEDKDDEIYQIVDNEKSILKIIEQDRGRVHDVSDTWTDASS